MQTHIPYTQLLFNRPAFPVTKVIPGDLSNFPCQGHWKTNGRSDDSLSVNCGQLSRLIRCLWICVAW